jgi:hypothetical protein
MNIARTLAITDEDLRKYYTIVFSPESNTRFINEFLYPLTRRQIDELLGYSTRYSARSTPGVCSYYIVKKGRYPALRFKIMCKNSGGKINPHEIRSDFDNDVLCKYGKSWITIDERSKNVVWDAICDGL